MYFTMDRNSKVIALKLPVSIKMCDAPGIAEDINGTKDDRHDVILNIIICSVDQIDISLGTENVFTDVLVDTFQVPGIRPSLAQNMPLGGPASFI